MSAQHQQPDEDATQTLVEMGFSKEQATQALEQSSGNIAYAANLLLTNQVSMLGNDSTTVLAALSQYDLPEGRSACTCIALTVAEKLLGDAPVNSETLTLCLYRGHELYIEHRQKQSFANTEHTSAEELLYLFPGMQLGEAGIRQGLLTSNGSCWSDLLASVTKPIAFCIIKPPESILVYCTSYGQYWLIDSHSRPPLYTQAYAQWHAAFDSLMASLQSLFPVTTSLPGVSSEMMAMYNSVDVYPLQIAQPNTSVWQSHE